MGGLEIDLTEGSSVFVYPKGEAHTPASYTVLNLVVPDIDEAVTQLEAAGVSLIRYPGFDQDERGVARSTDPTKGPTIGWITDPAGNIIALDPGLISSSYRVEVSLMKIELIDVP